MAADTPSLLGGAILQRLERTPMSGYELKKRFASSLGYGWRAYDTQIYRELKNLEQARLVEGRAEPHVVTPGGWIARAPRHVTRRHGSGRVLQRRYEMGAVDRPGHRRTDRALGRDGGTPAKPRRHLVLSQSETPGG